MAELLSQFSDTLKFNSYCWDSKFFNTNQVPCMRKGKIERELGGSVSLGVYEHVVLAFNRLVQLGSVWKKVVQREFVGSRNYKMTVNKVLVSENHPVMRTEGLIDTLWAILHGDK